MSSVLRDLKETGRPLGPEPVIVDLCWADDEPMTPPPSPSTATSDTINFDHTVPVSETLSGIGSGGNTTPRGTSIIVETDKGNQWGSVTSCHPIYQQQCFYQGYEQFSYDDINGALHHQDMYVY